MKYPDITVHKHGYPLIPEMQEPREPKNKSLIIVTSILLVLVGIGLIVDICLGKSATTIVVDILCMLVYITLIAVFVAERKHYKILKNVYDKYNAVEMWTESDPLTYTLGMFAKYQRGFWIDQMNARYGAYLIAKNPQELRSIGPVELENTSSRIDVILQDPEILKLQAKVDKAQKAVVDKVLQKYEEVKNLDPEELEKLEKEYKRKEKMREYSRKWSKR